ncbi:MAG TPA: helicase-related protein, partial [Longimicrobiales bacterium]
TDRELVFQQEVHDDAESGMAPDGSWEALVEEVAATLGPEQRRSLEQWAEKAPPSARTRDALLDHVASQRFARAAAEAGARWIADARTIDMGEATVEARLDGRVVRRSARLAPVPVTRSVWTEVREAPGEAALELARRAVAEYREHARREAREAFAETAGRIAELVRTLPDPEREGAVAEAVQRLANPSSSLRKLEKHLRQHALRTRMTGRANEMRGLSSDIRVIDLGGSVSFQREREVQLSAGGETFRPRLVARLHGGEFERIFLTGTLDEAAAALSPALDAELERMEVAARQAAAAIDAFVAERAGQPFYDLRLLHRIVRDELQRADELDEPGDALARIRARARRLDFEAREKEHVRRMVHERHLVAYKEYFAEARALKRQLRLYVGPTNSGKTWHALNALVEGESGVYLAPLRLLALEGQDEIQKRGKPASFITGEERDIVAGATFVASTIEMLDPRREYDCAVIDEVQLLTDSERGWAWCQALVGVAAKRVYMTGSLDCIPLVQAMAEYLGEPLEIVRLERFTPLQPLPHETRLSEVEPGTALIAFSRRDVLTLKAMLERRFPVSVIYGNLTPEVRREEARRFREGESQVLVSTDAIAMGLNLPIKTVLFSTLEKWNGKEEVQLSPAEILQIAGRAGRFGKHEEGFAGALRGEDVHRVRKVLAPSFKLPDRPLETRVRPAADHIALIAAGLETESLARTLQAFQRGMTFDSPLLHPGVTDDMVELAQVTDRWPQIGLAERLALSTTPIDTRNPTLMGSFEAWVSAFAQQRPVRLRPLGRWIEDQRAPGNEELHDAEIEAKRLTAYAWLSFRWPAVFPDLNECQYQRALLDRYIERGLARKQYHRRCVECGRALPPRSRFPTCKSCHRKIA